jgi:dipeptidyl-peptidase-4
LTKKPLFDHQRLAKILESITGDTIQSNDLPIQDVEILSEGQMKIHLDEQILILDLSDYSFSLVEEEGETPEQNQSISPDSLWTVFSKDYDLVLQSANGDLRQLTHDGNPEYQYGSRYGWFDLMVGETRERQEYLSVRWSPDSKWFYAPVCDTRVARKMYLLDWTRQDEFRPALLSYFRGSPGDSTMVYTHPVFFNSETGEKVTVPLDPGTHINPVTVFWSGQEDVVFLEETERGYKRGALYTFNLKTKELVKIYEEESATNINDFDWHFEPVYGKTFFLSEKSGWRQMYALDLISGQVDPLTRGSYYIPKIERTDIQQGMIYFKAAGTDQALNPYVQKLFKVDLNTQAVTDLTPGKKHHDISISPCGNYFFDNESTFTEPTKTHLRNTTSGDILVHISEAQIEKMGTWSPPESFTVKAADGKTEIYGALWKPSHFDPNGKYPVIDHSYTGPHTQVSPVSFRRAVGGTNQALAEFGFVVMMVDGRGSVGRSKQFQDFSYGNLGGGLDDHVAAIHQLGERYSWIDSSRVGIFGHSAGGYDAGRAVLAYGDTYDVAVASSADHDHRMEKAWWPEMYMGWPVDSVYHLQSNITNAKNLKGKLLITHGGLDDNVNPSATFKLAEALIQADKSFDMLILPSQRHGYQGRHGRYFTKTRWNYFIEHLLEQEPIWIDDWE